MELWQMCNEGQAAAHGAQGSGDALYIPLCKQGPDTRPQL